MQDSLFLYNGQILIGSIKGVSLGVLSFDDKDLKIVNVKLYKIKRLRADNNIFRIETIANDVYYGTIQPSDKNGYISIVTPEKKARIELTAINVLISMDKHFFKRLNGSVSLGFSYTKSSQIGQLNLSGQVGYATRHIENELSVSSLSSIDTSTFSRTNENVALFSNYNITPVWFVAGQLNYQRNLELSIKKRWQQIAGGGKKLIVAKNMTLLAMSGLAFTQETSTDDVNSGLLLEVPLILRYNFFQFQHPNLQISANQTTYFGITQSGRIRMDLNTSFSWELVRYFYLTMSPYMSFDNRPPVGTASNVDYGLVFGISYKF